VLCVVLRAVQSRYAADPAIRAHVLALVIAVCQPPGILPKASDFFKSAATKTCEKFTGFAKIRSSTCTPFLPVHDNDDNSTGDDGWSAIPVRGSGVR
jgi:hypothetical protein